VQVQAEVYLAAAKDTAVTAQFLHDSAHHAAAHYLAGVAVECLLRAYRVREDPEFDARHDVKELCRQSRFYTFVRADHAADVSEAVHVVWSRRQNDHRYRSQESLVSWLKGKRLKPADAGREAALRRSSERLIDAMHAIVQEGVLRWSRQH
jgi:hypothetical protein